MSEASRLRWLCRRGMKELDVVLTGYLDQCYPSANDDEQHQFKSLLEWPDPDLYALLLGRERASDPAMEALAQKLREYAANR